MSISSKRPVYNLFPSPVSPHTCGPEEVRRNGRRGQRAKAAGKEKQSTVFVEPFLKFINVAKASWNRQNVTDFFSKTVQLKRDVSVQQPNSLWIYPDHHRVTMTKFAGLHQKILMYSTVYSLCLEVELDKWVLGLRFNVASASDYISGWIPLYNLLIYIQHNLSTLLLSQYDERACLMTL